MSVSPQLGYFQLQEEIGRGGMGSVWRAKDPTLNREVAIKVLRDERSNDPKFIADFLQEARNAAAISHPHIAQVHLVGDAGGQYYIVMELLVGHSLRQILETEGQLDEERALDLITQVTEALRAAYKQRMIHGDIKPANIFITEDQGAKVLDFGLAKLANVEVTDTGGGIWGSPYYISPERVGQKAEDFRSDVYSLGATLFHALTGRPPFDAEDPAQLALKRLNEKPPLLRDINPEITVKTEQVVNKMLNKSILMRYMDYDALLKDLGDAKTEATAKRLGIDLHALDHPQPPVPALKSTPQPNKLPIIIGMSIAVIAVVIAVALVLWQNKHTPSNPPIPAPQPQPQPKPEPPKPPKLPKPPKPAATLPTAGCIGVGTWDTRAEFKDIKVTAPDGKVLFTSDFSTNSDGWTFLGDGEWRVQDGALRQMAEKESIRAIAGNKSWTDYTLELKARKLTGREGFLILFHIKDDKDHIWWNLGGWGNTQSAIEMGRIIDGKAGAIVAGRWYDIRVEVKGTSIKCWLDGKLIHDIDFRASQPSMMAYWPLDGNGEDASGNGHTLSFVGDPTFVPGHFGQALSLNGVNQYAKTAKLVLNTSEPFSVSAWVYWNGGGGGSNPTFLSQDGVNISGFWLQKHRDGRFRTAMRDGDSTTLSGDCIVESGPVPVVDTWYHLVGIYTGSELNLYVDGTLVDSKPFNSGFAALGSMIIGAGKWKTTSDHWDGLIDEVKVFNYALSDADVATLAGR